MKVLCIRCYYSTRYTIHYGSIRYMPPLCLLGENFLIDRMDLFPWRLGPLFRQMFSLLLLSLLLLLYFLFAIFVSFICIFSTSMSWYKTVFIIATKPLKSRRNANENLPNHIQLSRIVYPCHACSQRNLTASNSQLLHSHSSHCSFVTTTPTTATRKMTTLTHIMSVFPSPLSPGDVYSFCWFNSEKFAPN